MEKKKKSMAFELSKHEGQPLAMKGSFIERVEPKVLGKHALIRGRGKTRKDKYISMAEHLQE